MRDVTDRDFDHVVEQAGLPVLGSSGNQDAGVAER